MGSSCTLFLQKVASDQRELSQIYIYVYIYLILSATYLLVWRNFFFLHWMSYQPFSSSAFQSYGWSYKLYKSLYSKCLRRSDQQNTVNDFAVLWQSVLDVADFYFFSMDALKGALLTPSTGKLHKWGQSDKLRTLASHSWVWITHARFS